MASGDWEIVERHSCTRCTGVVVSTQEEMDKHDETWHVPDRDTGETLPPVDLPESLTEETE